MKRYTEGGYGVSEMEEDQNGGWVRYEDHLKEISKIRQQFIATERQQFIATEADGWIAWGGGECPVSENERVGIRFTDGANVITSSPKHLRWQHLGASGDIIAYRVIENDGREG